MAQKPLSTAAAERMNLVAQDEIWKYRLKAESEARQNWPQNWGFLTTPFEELIKCEEDLPTPKPKIELPERFRIRPVTPVEKYIKVLPSPPVPQTTQGFIGWRSAVPGLNKCLELDDEIRSCKGKPQETTKRRGRILSHRFQREPGPADALTSNFWTLKW
uniref:Ciliary microtubule inner protein 1 n=1 Tax=Papio anubis TaxID=9555 RepID=A0A8I5N5V2_PAPAN